MTEYKSNIGLIFMAVTDLDGNYHYIRADFVREIMQKKNETGSSILFHDLTKLDIQESAKTILQGS